MEFISTEGMTPETAPAGRVLVQYLEPFFGLFTVGFGIGYFENSYDTSRGWWLAGSQEPIRVLAYAVLPEPLKLNGEFSGQLEFHRKYGEWHPNYGSVGELIQKEAEVEQPVVEPQTMVLEPSIQLHSGAFFHFTDHQPEDINIEDIAHALSNICRFTGHTSEFYSVAQHSVLVSSHVPDEHKLTALLHDATEAYINDMSKPLKDMATMEAYNQLEDHIWASVAKRFDLPIELPFEVKVADKRMLFTEKRDLMKPIDWGYMLEPYRDKVECWPARLAKNAFLNAFEQYSNKRFYSPHGETVPLYNRNHREVFSQNRLSLGEFIAALQYDKPTELYCEGWTNTPLYVIHQYSKNALLFHCTSAANTTPVSLTWAEFYNHTRNAGSTLYYHRKPAEVHGEA